MTAKLITKAQLIENGRRSQVVQKRGKPFAPKPVAQLFTLDDQATWLLTEVDLDTLDIAFSFCDLGLGLTELGAVSEIKSMRGQLSLSADRDRHI